MSNYGEKLLINSVHADPGGCMCIIYFLDSKFNTFSLLANTNDPENRFQKLNGIHRSRLSHWNCHTDSLTFVARSHLCHQALAMIKNATNDSLANWVLLWTLTYPVLMHRNKPNITYLLILFCWSRHWIYSFSCKMVIEWQIYVQPWLHFLSLRWMWESQENILLDNRAPIQIWIWWWRNCYQNCSSLKQDHDFLPWIKG